MQPKRLLVAPVTAWMLALCAVSATLPAYADEIDWAKWSSATPGTPGSASATIGSLTVSYSGQNSGLLTNYPSWTPTSSYIGGVVGNAPPAANNSIQIEGGSPITETITFSSKVADPIFAVWSLGQPSSPASFDFTASEPFSVVAGGPSAEFGGNPLTVSGNNVLGAEANGVIQFNGDFTSITFTTPSFENYYAFTVGEDQTLTSQLPGGPTGPSTVPEPGTLSLFALGLGSLAFARLSGWLRHS
jgi:PEP-CTERM motif